MNKQPFSNDSFMKILNCIKINLTEIITIIILLFIAFQQVQQTKAIESSKNTSVTLSNNNSAMRVEVINSTPLPVQIDQTKYLAGMGRSFEDAIPVIVKNSGYGNDIPVRISR